MILLKALSVAILAGCGLYSLMQRSWLHLVIGIALLGQAANLYIFFSSVRDTDGKSAPILDTFREDSHLWNLTQFTDPLPQALILTAIVIGFGMQAYFLVLAKRAFQAHKSLDIENLKNELCSEKPGVNQ